MNKTDKKIEEILKRHLIIPWGDNMQPDNLLIEELNTEVQKSVEVELRKFAREIWEMSKALYDKTVLDSGVNRDNYNSLCRINKKCAELLEGGKKDDR